MTRPRLHAKDAVTRQDEFRLHLQNASRRDTDSSSNRALRKMLRDPEILDWLEVALDDASIVAALASVPHV